MTITFETNETGFYLFIQYITSKASFTPVSSIIYLFLLLGVDSSKQDICNRIVS